MGVKAGPRIVTNGLICDLDPAQIRSYSGSGNTWYVFRDGVEQTKTLVSGSYSNAVPNFTEPLRIGIEDSSSTDLNSC